MRDVCELLAEPYTKVRCESCARGKIKARSFKRRPKSEVSQPAQVMSSDVATMTPRSAQRNKYLAIVVDYFSGWGFGFGLRTKDESFKAIQDAYVHVKRQFGWSIGTLRLDEAGEYKSHAIRSWSRARDVLLVHSSPHDHEQHGHAERYIGTIFALARTSVLHAGAPACLWDWACLDSIQARNVCPRKDFLGHVDRRRRRRGCRSSRTHPPHLRCKGGAVKIENKY